MGIRTEEAKERCKENVKWSGKGTQLNDVLRSFDE